MKSKAIIFLILLSAFKLQGPYKIGDKINNFVLVNSIDNKEVALSDYSKEKALALVFTSNECPYSKLYENRLLQIAKQFEDKNIKFLFVNPNNSRSNPEDSPQAMAKKAADKGYSFPYLIDNNQQLSNRFGATKTPEVFVLKNINGNFILKYKGAIDDNPQVETDVNQNYLRDVLTSMITNDGLKQQETRATGCMIKK